MSARNRKSFDDKMSTSPSNLQEDPEIEETPDLTGVANENSTDGDEMSSPPPLILQEASNSGLIAKINYDYRNLDGNLDLRLVFWIWKPNRGV